MGTHVALVVALVASSCIATPQVTTQRLARSATPMPPASDNSPIPPSTILNHWTFHDPNLPQDALIDEAWPVSPDDRVRRPMSNNEWVPLDAHSGYLLEATAAPR
jgi:hypothetical protein